MNLKNITSIRIPEGNVTEIRQGKHVIWSNSNGPGALKKITITNIADVDKIPMEMVKCLHGMNLFEATLEYEHATTKIPQYQRQDKYGTYLKYDINDTYYDSSIVRKFTITAYNKNPNQESDAESILDSIDHSITFYKADRTKVSNLPERPTTQTYPLSFTKQKNWIIFKFIPSFSGMFYFDYGFENMEVTVFDLDSIDTTPEATTALCQCSLSLRKDHLICMMFSWSISHWVTEEIINYSGLCFAHTEKTSWSIPGKIGLQSGLGWSGYYSKDGVDWINYNTAKTGTLSLPQPESKVYFKGIQTSQYTSASHLNFTAGYSTTVSGNILSLFNGDNYATTNSFPYDGSCYGLFQNTHVNIDSLSLPTTLRTNCYREMFKGVYLTSVPKNLLSSKSLAESCYAGMFMNCRFLTNTPDLPATTLKNYCYQDMFNGCEKLTAIPTLPATVLGTYCYNQMFMKCYKLTDISTKLPATTLTSSCYKGMFSNCTSLTTIPNEYLPSTGTGRTGAYQSMFSGCTSLVNVPANLIKNNIIEQDTCAYMFNGCTSLVTAPSLPATSVYQGGYQYMFNGCTSLVNAPSILPATAPAYSTYEGMFMGCKALKKAPYIKARLFGYEKSSYHMRYMFKNCINLEAIPQLFATSIPPSAYQEFFSGCTKVKFSTTQDDEYVNEYRIPSSGEGTGGTNWGLNMFTNTGGSFTGTPELNTTYYTSNEIVQIPE